MTAPAPAADSTLAADLLKAIPEGWEALRAGAVEALRRQDLPTKREEDWKYLDLSALRQAAFRPAAPAAVDIRERILPEARGTRLVFVNGRFDPHHSCTSALPQGLRCLPLHAASEAAPRLGSLLEPAGSDFFANLNTAAFSEGAFVFVPKGIRADAPLHLLFLSVGGEGILPVTLPRIFIEVERGASLELLEEYAGTGAYLTSTAVEILVHEGAELRHERVQRESPEAYHVSSLRADVAKDARYLSRTISFGAKLSRQTPQVRLLGPGAEASLDGLALLNGKQVADTHSVMDHTVPHGTSRQLHKCIVDDEAQAVFNGRVFVRPEAQQTDAQQQCRTLLLSEKATVDAKPQLEIDADDVKCSHGAAVGALDPEELFYLASRGLDPVAARNLLTYGFASDLLARIPVASLRRALRQQVMARTNASDLVETP
ncbi:MAG: Fe-S cluster assembly protein SufD [Holophagaceae bacterium]